VSHKEINKVNFLEFLNVLENNLEYTMLINTLLFIIVIVLRNKNVILSFILI